MASMYWLFAGSVSMGIGIWTMHFVGMLAFDMGGMEHAYDVFITAVSLVVGMAASAFAIWVGSQKNVGFKKLCFSGIVLGLGIAGMHYTGMEAMRMQAKIVYDPVLVTASVVIAIVAATAAIWIAFTLTHTVGKGSLKLKLAAAVVMGIAICGMHYTGMAAANYIPVAHDMSGITDGLLSSLHSKSMAYLLAIAALVILGVTHMTLYFDYKIAIHKEIGKQAEREAIRLNEILDDSSNEIYVFETETYKFLSVNKGATKNLGYSVEQLTTMTPVDLSPEYSIEEFEKKLQPLVSGEKRQIIYDTVNRRADGTSYPVDVHLQLSTTSDEPVFVGIVADITERKSLEEQIAQARKLESIGQLAAGIAHEINTPAQFIGDNNRYVRDAVSDLLSVLSAYERLADAALKGTMTTDMLDEIKRSIEEFDLDFLKDEVPEAIKQSLDGIDRISKIVSAMKEFSHPGTENKELVDINKTIENTVIVASNEWKYIAEVNTEFDEQLPSVKCHPQEVSQVFLNIIVNAAHAIAETHTESNSKKGNIGISTFSREDAIEIRITDSGCGIPDDIRNRVFDPFFTTKEVGKGTGQGLSIAYSIIVDKHNGKLDIESEVGKGTTFIITLPIEHSENAGLEDAA